ncbi:MAG: potassium transporter Kup [Parachlamydiaceae bacterium]|nr:potassium transporter Kup [Parachlamydiaceae bacterium]
MDNTLPHSKKKSDFSTLLVGTLGVVFGDIGTSPLYALREALTSHRSGNFAPESIFSVLSLVFWTIMIVVSLKYVSVIMSADNNGEGGSLALLALANKTIKNSNVGHWVTILGLCGAGFFYGNCILTPAISVLSATEGLTVVNSNLKIYIIPITLIIISSLFWIQSRGTKKIGLWFGTVMVFWFITISFLGLINILKHPSVLKAINPYYAFSFIGTNHLESFWVLGGVFLSVTGGETLYADMGHFGKSPIRFAWFIMVLPALLLNYFGQGALLLEHPESIISPFYLLAPPTLQLPLVILATLATIIASQAVISGAFSIFQQAMQMDYLPRITVIHTSDEEKGQIYVPFANWSLYLGVILVVIFFQTSSNLAGAYGIAVSGTMMISTILVTIVMKYQWNWSNWKLLLIMSPIFLFDLIFLIANSIKIPHGGWFSLLIGIFWYIILSTWIQGRKIVLIEEAKHSMKVINFIPFIEKRVSRIKGTAIVLTSDRSNVPSVLLCNIKHNQILHEQIILVNVITENVPYVGKMNRIELISYDKGFYRIILRYGFMQAPNVPRALAGCQELGLSINLMKVSYFLSHSIIIPTKNYKMGYFHEHLFAFMSRNATNAVDFFHIPSNQVIQLGIRTEV